MAKIIKTHELDYDKLSHQHAEWIYNGLDCCVTSEVFDVLRGQTDNLTTGTYTFSRALQGPVLEMRLRGVAVDLHRRDEVLDEWAELLVELEAKLETIVDDGLGLSDFNWRSNKMLLPSSMTLWEFHLSSEQDAQQLTEVLWKSWSAISMRRL